MVYAVRHIAYTKEERLHLMTFDSDLFNRYDVGQQYALESMLEMVNRVLQKR